MPRKNLYRVFWSLAEQDTDLCIVWPYGKGGQSGYGMVQVPLSPQKDYVHRLAYLIFVGPIEGGKHVLHHCDNPPCFNPKHLFLGTPQDNQSDSKAKGRTKWKQGIGNPCAELSEEDVRKIRAIYRFGVRGFGILALGEQFGVSHSTIRKAVRRLTWKHVV
jgi:HNH endonuclease